MPILASPSLPHKFPIDDALTIDAKRACRSRRQIYAGFVRAPAAHVDSVFGLRSFFGLPVRIVRIPRPNVNHVRNNRFAAVTYANLGPRLGKMKRQRNAYTGIIDPLSVVRASFEILGTAEHRSDDTRIESWIRRCYRLRRRHAKTCNHVGVLRNAVLIRVVHFRRIPRTGEQRVLTPHWNALYVAAVNETTFGNAAPILAGNQTMLARHGAKKHVRLVIFGVLTIDEHAEIGRNAVTMTPNRTELRHALHE